MKKQEREKPPWSEYYRATAKWPPANTLVKALELAGVREGKEFAVDLGCGAGRDTLELLKRGWHVLAMDNEPKAIRFLRTAIPGKYRGRLRTRRAAFETVKLPKCDLINGSYSLPFCRPESFNDFWRRMVNALRPNGLLVGQLFGVHDEWANSTDMTFHTASEVESLSRSLKVEFFEEKEWDGTTASG